MRNGPSLRPIMGVFFLKWTPFWKMPVLNPIPFCLLFCLSEETEDKIPQCNNIIPTLGAQGKSRKRRWKDCRRQRTRIPLVGPCLLDMTGKLQSWNRSIRIVQARLIVCRQPQSAYRCEGGKFQKAQPQIKSYRKSMTTEKGRTGLFFQRWNPWWIIQSLVFSPKHMSIRATLNELRSLLFFSFLLKIYFSIYHDYTFPSLSSFPFLLTSSPLQVHSLSACYLWYRYQT